MALDGGAAHVEEFDHLVVRFVVDRPGRFLLKVTYTPYWQLDGGSVREGDGRFTEVEVPAAGRYELRFDGHGERGARPVRPVSRD